MECAWRKVDGQRKVLGEWNGQMREAVMNEKRVEMDMWMAGEWNEKRKVDVREWMKEVGQNEVGK